MMNCPEVARKLTRNCSSEGQLLKILAHAKKSYAWRDEWPTLQVDIQTEGAAAISRHQTSTTTA
ncbi:hypothetical protein PK28_09680 [Hymenobacter sp. DG25B]|uniref:hypothetical protein n=1 Tax=Hymenobacter sp. DG25B TaxID=1385664 RepID=UPI0005407766|nr:hypothetical protein [Hymenobacter sp. DG25B]AIZ63888.1 hypothetical protein PK28_09680 [Hymenobacter sp. DG25B]